MNYKKNFIGKGKKVNDMNIIKVNLNVAEAMKFTHEFKGKEYLTMEISKLRDPDQFGNEYTVYVTTREEDKSGSNGKRKSSSKKQKTEEPAF